MATAVHLWLVTYDIRQDRARNKVADVLEGWGERVQYSIFGCRSREADAPKLGERLKKVLLRKVLRTKERGSARMYRVCARCAAKSVGFGDIEPPDEDVAIVR